MNQMQSEEIAIERLSEAHDREMSRLGLGAAPYQTDDDLDEFDWDGWHIDHEIDRMREDMYE